MITHSETITKIAGAMLAVQGAVASVKRDSQNPHFRSHYASLESVIDTIRPACQKASLVVIQAPGDYLDGHLEIETMIVHSASGEWFRSALTVPVQKPDPQGVGSAVTYACRYSLMAVFNLAPTDDDGNAASGPAPTTPASVVTVRKPVDQAKRIKREIGKLTSEAELNNLIGKSTFTAAFGEVTDEERAAIQIFINETRKTFIDNEGAE